jgi:hypothetical protein
MHLREVQLETQQLYKWGVRGGRLAGKRRPRSDDEELDQGAASGAALAVFALRAAVIAWMS